MLQVSTALRLLWLLAIMEWNAQRAQLQESLAMLATTNHLRVSHRAMCVKQVITANSAMMLPSA